MKHTSYESINRHRRFCIAPMIDWSDRHFRYLVRLLSQHALVYTEMITTGAILHGPKDRLLRYAPEEHPIAIQLGGSDPQALAECADIAETHGFDEINLNVGCPSDRVQSGRFGACLMAEPNLVAECVDAMQTKVNIPVTVKSRIGIDNQDSYEAFYHFINTVQQSGCQHFTVHARKAWLSGLSPKENRTIPPLHYDYVFNIKKAFPHLNIILNGGITSVDTGLDFIQKGQVDGVMLGRAAYHNPFILSSVDPLIFDSPAPVTSRYQLLERYYDYISTEISSGTPLKSITRHMLGLFQHQYGGKRWRRHLSEQAHTHSAHDSVDKALHIVKTAADLTRT